MSNNEIRTGLNKPDEFILAIVEVDGEQTHTVCLKNLFRKALDFTTTSANYDITQLKQQSETELER